MAVVPSASTHPLASGESLLRSLLALSELHLRLYWLADRVTGSTVNITAPALNELAERAQSSDPRAREGLFSVAIFLAQRRDTAMVWALREKARSTALLNLERLLRERKDVPEAEVELEPRVPDYGTGRELTVGERRSLARRPTRVQIERLILDPHPLVLEQLFKCPSLTENDVVQIATRRPARMAALELLAENPKWMARRRVRMSLILNPATPHGLALPLVSTCRRDDLDLIVRTSNISKTIRSVALELRSRQAPLEPPASQLSH